jgi:hypothetical protein
MEWIEHPAPGLGAGGRVAVVGYLGHAADGRYDNPHHARREPQAFRVDTPPGSDPLRTHFHTVDQFQFVGWGAGRIGGHDVASGCVHYADRFTPYGPLTSGPGGYAYLTLRGTTDMGISYMPEGRAELREALAGGERDPRSRRSLTLDLHAADASAVPPGTWARVVDDPDGLVVAVTDCPPGRAVGAPPAGAAGAYLVVVAGTVDGGDGGGGGRGAPVTAGAVRWCPPGSAPSLVAAGDGARVALLRFPDSRPPTPLTAAAGPVRAGR